MCVAADPHLVVYKAVVELYTDIYIYIHGCVILMQTIRPMAITCIVPPHPYEQAVSNG